jgi:hypothetical protein
MADSHDPSKPTTFTQCCRDLIGRLSYEDILSCTVYLPPMLFMVGPAAIVANSPLINLILNAIVGFAISWTLHRMGHRILMALPNEPQPVYLSQSVRLPVKLTLTQFVWMMEIIVAAAVFSGIVGKRLFLIDGTVGLLTSAIFFALGLGLYFLPVYLARLRIDRYYPRMPLLSPTETVMSQSLLGVLPISIRRKGPGR